MSGEPRAVGALPWTPPLADIPDLCEASRQAVIEFEDEMGFDGCPLCGRGSFHHRDEEETK